MATDPTAAPVTFSSPSMRARAHLVRGLQYVDELERAWARRDYWTARGAARLAAETLDLAQQAFTEAWGHTDTLEAVEPQEPSASAVLAALVADPAPAPADPAEGMAQYQADGR